MALTVEERKRGESLRERLQISSTKKFNISGILLALSKIKSTEACLRSANVAKPRVGISLCKILDKRKSLVWCPMTAATLTQDSDCDNVVSVQNWQL